MDFFEHQDRARRQSFVLVGYFVAAVVAVVLAIYAAAVGIMAIVASKTEQAYPLTLWHPELFICVTSAVLIVITTGSLYKMWMIGGGGEHVAMSLGGRKVPSNTTDLAERILLNVVEEMALASGTPVPPVYVMDDEMGINAFAAGTTPQNAVIGVTRGAIDTFSREELQGVIAHEFSHILNGDMKLNIRLMGWLHGILVIAIVGYSIFRMMGHSTGRRSSSRKEEGGLMIALFLAATALMVIGYIGVFFAQWIKSAVSRQREFLADASAVQFTRNPIGIASALKKIGGWSEHSKIQSPRAEEASHMFFGAAGIASMFATHPPLITRVKRIDPNFSGVFPETTMVRHSTSELIDPRSLSLQRSSFQESHSAAIEGAESFSAHESKVVEQVGEPRLEHIEHAKDLVGSFEQRLLDDVHDALGAVATIYAMLLAPEASQHRAEQMQLLFQLTDRRPLAEMKRIQPAVDRLAPEQRLPIVCMALPALHQLSPPQINEFHQMALQLIRVDRQISLFEYAVQRFIRKRLLLRLEQRQEKTVENANMSTLRGPFAIALSSIAYACGSRSQTTTAFESGARSMGDSQLQLLVREQCTLVTLDQALDQLAHASPKLKRRMLMAFSACIASDDHVTVEEAEMLRVFADALGCPVPPLLNERSVA